VWLGALTPEEFANSPGLREASYTTAFRSQNFSFQPFNIFRRPFPTMTGVAT
jgi:hypothetical protein